MDNISNDRNELDEKVIGYETPALVELIISEAVVAGISDGQEKDNGIDENEDGF